MKRRRARQSVALALVVVAAGACDPNVVPQVKVEDVVSILITPDSVDLPIGDSIQLTAHPLDGTGALLGGIPLTWQAGDPGVATVDENGMVTAVSVGSTQIAASGAGASTSVVVRVDVPPEIAFDADSIGFATVAGDPDPTPETVNVTNDGAFALVGLTVDTITYGAGAADWLMATLDQGLAPAVLTVAPMTAGVTTAGTYTATVLVSGTDASNAPAPITVTLVVSAGAATMVVANDGDGQTAAVGAAVATAPSVLITDAFDNPISGVTADFAVTAGGGSITGGSAISGADGVARVGSWTLGMTTGVNGLSATVAGFAPVPFTATAIAGAPARIEITSGDGQTATAGAAVTIAPAVTVFDAFDNGVEGVDVTFSVTGGGGSVAGSPTASDAAGLATLGSWTLGTTAGPNTMVATAAGLADTLTFSATAIPGVAANLALDGGDAQTDTVGAMLPTPYSVLVTDANANPVAGITVTWAVTAGGGSLPGVSATDATGIATAAHTFGTTLGAQVVTATVAGLSGSPVTFNSTATVGAPASMTAAGGDGQTATVDTNVATAPSVTVLDGFGNPIAGETVTFAVTGGGGSVAGGSAVTDGAGTAQVTSWTLGQAAGANELTATLNALTPVVFTATGTADAAAALQLNDGDGQSAIAGNAVATAPSVLVVDQFGNPVQGVTVDYGNITGGGSVTGGSPSSGADGIATVGSWTLGASAGANSLDATSVGIPTTITFNATAISGSADSMYVDSGDAQTDTVGATLATPYTVRVVDTNDNGVAGIPISWSVTAGGGSLINTTNTDASGFATATHVFGTSVGTQTAQAAVGGVSGSPIVFNSTATAGAPAIASVNAGDGQTATVNTNVAVDPSVLVTDQFGNPIDGLTVTFAVTDGNSSITGATPVTDPTGIATVGSWQLQPTAGTNNNTLSATPTGLSAVNFTASGTADAPTQLDIDLGDGQSATAGSPVAVAPQVQVLDQFDNPVQGVTVTFSVSGGGGSTTGATPTTDGSGVAAVGSWTLGATAGANSLDASVVGIGSPVTFNATGTVGAAANIALNGGNGQTGTVDQNLSTALSVLVTDANANPVSGVTVTWGVGGGGSITSSSFTNGSGIATATRTLGTTAGAQTATGSVGGLTGSPVNFSMTATADAPNSMVVNAGNLQSATVGTPVATDPSVLIRDQFLNPVSGVSVTFSATAGGGSVTGGSPNTNASGVATVGEWELGTVAGTNNNQLTASSTGLTNVVFTASANAGSPSSITIVNGNSQTANVGNAVTTDPSVRVEDAFGNDIAGVTVSFVVTFGGGSVTSASPTTNASGIATVGSWTLQDGATMSSTGTFANTLRASATGTGNVFFSGTARYSYTNDVDPLWSSNSSGSCIGCHTFLPNTSAFANWSSIVGVTSGCNAAFDLAATGGGTAAENNSTMIQRLDDTNGGSGCTGVMPDGGSNLTVAERNIVRAWIRNGVPFN
ncbi:MAG: hypothetical protein AAF389_06395 [Gemmatimonadota bacterium]